MRLYILDFLIHDKYHTEIKSYKIYDGYLKLLLLLSFISSAIYDIPRSAPKQAVLGPVAGGFWAPVAGRSAPSFSIISGPWSALLLYLLRDELRFQCFRFCLDLEYNGILYLVCGNGHFKDYSNLSPEIQ